MLNAATASTGGGRWLRAWPWLALAADLLALTLAGLAWRETALVRGAFGPVESLLLAAGFGASTLWLLRRLGPPSPARRAQHAASVAEVLLTPATLGAPAALLALSLLGAPAADALLLWAVAAAAGLLPGRLLLAQAARRGLASGRLRPRLAILGGSETARQLILALRALPPTERPLLIGLYEEGLSPDGLQSIAGVPVCGNLRDLTALCARQRVDVLAVAVRDAATDEDLKG